MVLSFNRRAWPEDQTVGLREKRKRKRDGWGRGGLGADAWLLSSAWGVCAISVRVNVAAAAVNVNIDMPMATRRPIAQWVGWLCVIAGLVIYWRSSVEETPVVSPTVTMLRGEAVVDRYAETLALPEEPMTASLNSASSWAAPDGWSLSRSVVTHEGVQTYFVRPTASGNSGEVTAGVLIDQGPPMVGVIPPQPAFAALRAALADLVRRREKGGLRDYAASDIREQMSGSSAVLRWRARYQRMGKTWFEYGAKAFSERESRFIFLHVEAHDGDRGAAEFQQLLSTNLSP